MTNISEIESLLEKYRTWLKDKTSLKSIHDGWIEITTPFLDRHNDCIQIYAKKENGHFTIVDDGNTIRDLEASGLSLDNVRRRQLLETTLRGFGVELVGDALRIKATDETFAARKHAILQAVMAVNDLFYLATPMSRSYFREDVEAWLSASDVRYLPSIQFVGRTGYTHHFDFAVPSSKGAPERLIRAMNSPSKSNTETLIFAWLDTRESRPASSIAIAMLNDTHRSVPSATLEAFEHYDIRPIPWSKREQHLELIAA